MVILELEMGQTAIQTSLGKQNHWAIVCPDSRVKGGLWKKWLAEKCVAIGWSPKSYRMHGSTQESGWRRARKRVQEIVPGDIVIPYLRNYTFGVPGKVVRVAAGDEEWSPTVSAGNDTEYPGQWTLGRRIKVEWLEKEVPFDKVAVVPKAMRWRGGVIRPAIEPLNEQRFARIMRIIRTPGNWRPYQQVQANNGNSRATSNSKVPVEPNRSTQTEYGGNLSDVEGMLTEVQMTRRGRSRRLRNAALQKAAGVCTVCRIDFREILVGRGVRVLQVHHLSQLAATDAPRITRLKDLAVVCANCHILLHLNSKRALKPSTLRRMLQKVPR
jgi:hypothetical protein